MTPYCNFCKYFDTTVNGSPSHIVAYNDWYGLGCCKKLERMIGFFSSCECFTYLPLKNPYNIESAEFVEDWANNRAIVSNLWGDILDYKAEQVISRR